MLSNTATAASRMRVGCGAKWCAPTRLGRWTLPTSGNGDGTIDDKETQAEAVHRVNAFLCCSALAWQERGGQTVGGSRCS